MLDSSDFHYTSNETTEEILRYVPGGYHPIIMGDILHDPRTADGPGYRIMHKLGYGAFATVWLAQNTDTNVFFSVKVTAADCSTSQEVEMLKAASRFAHECQENNIISLVDSRAFDGPNGRHTVLVTDVVAPLSSLHHTLLPPAWRKTVALGLARALQQLHASGIVHGDFHTGNAGVSVPQLAQQDQLDVMQDLSYPELTVVLTTTAAKQTSSLPAYLVMPCDIAAYYLRIKLNEPPQTLVFDFGTAHEVGTHPDRFQCAAGICALEVAFTFSIEKNENPPVDCAADIWALGISIFEIVAGSSLFYGTGLPGIPYRAVEQAGYVPTAWETWWATVAKPPDVSPTAADKFWAEQRKMLRLKCEDDADVDGLIRLLKKILALDPAARPSAAEVVNDAWFVADSAKIGTEDELIVRDGNTPGQA
ncbi:kinase-like protein [Auricularia subglabra TFB-10046 SS5]|nr:kinase-like protein [Auricularia subglabra TFB-10046 SS5]